MSLIKSIVERKIAEILPQLPGEATTSKPAHQIEFMYLYVLNKFFGSPRFFSTELQNDWLHQIRENQQADGHFLQSATVTDFNQLAFTALSVGILQIADLDIRFPLYSTRIFKDPTFTENWFQETQHILITPDCSITKALQTGKTFLYTTCLLNKSVNDGFLEDTVLSYFLDCSDARANPETGFWLQNESKPSIQALVDSWSRIQAYSFLNRPLPYPQKMLHSVLHLQKRNGHFHSNEENFLLVDLVAMVILAALSQPMRSINLRIRRKLKRVVKAVNQIVPLETDSIPVFPKSWLCESLEFEDESENNLQEIVLLYYRLIFEQLAATIFTKSKFEFKLATSSPCFTFQY